MARPQRSAATLSLKKVKEILDQSNPDEEERSDVSDISSSDSSDFSDEDVNIKSNENHERMGCIGKAKVDSEFLILSSDDEDDEPISVRQEKKFKAVISSKKTAGKLPKRKNGKAIADQQNLLEWQSWENAYLEESGHWGDDFGDIDLEDTSNKQIFQTAEPPPELLMSLLPFQREWLWWSLNQEALGTRGGILADEMGMGKTIQAIALILASRAHNCQPLTTSTSMPHSTSLRSPADDLPQMKATLVVCPLVAVIQWRNEIARYTKEGSVKVLLYHGLKRCKILEELANYDVILTTYAIVEQDYRDKVMPAKEPCKWCRKLFYPHRMVIHLKYFCGPDAQKSAKQSKQVRKKPKGKVNHEHQEGLNDKMTYKGKSKTSSCVEGESSEDDMPVKSKQGGHGRGRKRKIQAVELESAIAEAVASLNEANGASTSNQRPKKVSLLHAVKWNRIILDEAHCIKDRKCSTAKAVFALRSNFKWALSGTPLQNRVGELYSLVRFLEVSPFSYYFCKNCDCKSLDYSFDDGKGKCNSCGHSAMVHFCWWNKFVANPIKKWGFRNEGRKVMILLKHKLLNSVLLRRTKLERAADLALPPSAKFLRRDNFDAREEDFYQALYTQSQSQFNTYVSSGTLLNNYAHIFDLLTRLRQAVDHPYLVVYSKTASGAASLYATAQGDESNAAAQGGQSSAVLDELCSICSDPFEEPITTSCKHTFCKTCIQDFVSSAAQPAACPMCQCPLTVDFTPSNNNSQPDVGNMPNGYKRSSILSRIDLNQFQTSTKIDALREEIDEMLERDFTAKAIVFSQFTSFLDLIGFSLEKFGIKCVKLDGSMSISARDKMIEKFTNDADIKVFLMSLKAGGVALNLTVASHVFLMDPWWNPAVEQQAQDRIHRLGQFKPIRVVRFIIENTIEERILKLQEKKQLVFEGTVGGSAEALGRLTAHDLCFLFNS